MSGSLPNDERKNSLPEGNDYSFGIVVSEWNEDITHKLLVSCKNALLSNGANKNNIHILEVPGTFELPFGAKLLLKRKKMDAVICLGCVIKGDTKHNEYISNSVANSISHLGLMSGVPIIFGVLTPENLDQAIERAGGDKGDKGEEAGLTAIRMVNLAKNLNIQDKKIGF
jgi:6,7-dimethyl-8-ribityllumazine synthase